MHPKTLKRVCEITSRVIFPTAGALLIIDHVYPSYFCIYYIRMKITVYCRIAP